MIIKILDYTLKRKDTSLTILISDGNVTIDCQQGDDRIEEFHLDSEDVKLIGSLFTSISKNNDLMM
tara:strand:- start:7522 stop:7719 length:198 start_codon:yes stop_codon:yes gene_type:complete